MSAVDETTCRCRVTLPDRGVETYWLEVLQRNTETNRDYCLPDIGEMVAVLLDDREESGCVLGAVYTDENRPTAPSRDVRRVTFGDNAVVEYDRAAHRLRVITTGSVQVNGETVEVNAQHVNVTGAVEVVGNAHVDGTVTVRGGASQVARADLVADALSALADAIRNGVPVPQDGGVALQASIVAALAGWPPSVAATDLSTD